jgi:hypothetical protein
MIIRSNVHPSKPYRPIISTDEEISIQEGNVHLKNPSIYITRIGRHFENSSILKDFCDQSTNF